MARRRLSLPWWWIAFALMAVDTWGNRYNLNPDGISYLDMARYAASGDAAQLINGYWSPGYPILLLPIFAGRFTTAVLIPWLHLTNVIVFAVGLSAFARAFAAAPSSFGRGWRLFGFILFTMIAIVAVSGGLLTPDMAVLVAVVFAAGSVLQLEGDAPQRAATALGAALGVGFWLKGIVLPLALLLLALLWLFPPRVAGGRRLVMRAGVIFAVFALPLVLMVSRRVGHLSAGEVGRLNYAWEVGGVLPFVGWTGDSNSANGKPVHPPRVVSPEPETLEFATPIGGTYPLWYDASYWYAGVRARLDWRGQRAALQRSGDALGEAAGRLWPLGLALLLVWLATERSATVLEPHRDGRRMRRVVLLWSAGGVAAYALVHVESRYLAGFLAAAILAISHYLAARRARPMLRIALPVGILVVTIATVRDAWINSGGYAPGYRPDYLVAADALRQRGVARGSDVAMVGDAFEAYAAFAADLRTTAQIVDSTSFWSVPAAQRLAVQQRLAALGVRALLANNVAPSFAVEGWQFVANGDGANLGVLILKGNAP